MTGPGPTPRGPTTKGPPVVVLDEIDSTNAEARRRAEAGEAGPVWIVGLRQTAGLDAAVERQCLLRTLRQVGVAHGVAVNGGVGERRQRQRRRDIARHSRAPLVVTTNNRRDIPSTVDRVESTSFFDSSRSSVA